MELKPTLPKYKEIAEGMRLWKSLRQHEQIKPKIYFDSASLIDMLTGTSSVFRGGKFDDELYERPANLVYALAYRKWLGDIYTLPPHTEELIDALRFKQHLFPEERTEESKNQQDELWDRLLTSDDLKEFQNLLRSKDSKAIFKAVKQHPYHIFIGLCLTAGANYWKRRYKTLVKDQQVLKFSHKEDYGFQDVTQSDLFKKVNDVLNQKRSRTANNYMDAVALCLLNEKLQRAIDGQGKVVLPLFFSDQQHILDTVTQLSKTEKDPNTGRAPFIFSDPKTKQEFPIVREAGFFVIEGFVNALRENQGEQAVIDLEETLEAILSFSDELKVEKSNKAATININKNYLQPELHEKVLLEFFDRWWHSGGVNDVVSEFELNYDAERDAELDKAISEEVDEDRRRLTARLKGFEPRMRIIRKAWAAFPDLSKFLNQAIVDAKAEMNALKEFAPRYNFSVEVCETIQNWIDPARDAAGYESELRSIVAEVVNTLISGLFEQPKDEEASKKRLDQIASSLGFFFFFERYALVQSACEIIREQYERQALHSTDKYPTPALALLHAAAVLKVRKGNDVEKAVLEIINCVDGKNKQNYKIWIGLSYLYNLLWEYRIKGYRFRELYESPETFEREMASVGVEYLNKARAYSKQALDFLTPEKREQRQLKFYYALNNYVFFSTFYTSPEEFNRLSTWAEQLEDISYDPSCFQRDRFSDTLARYNFRRAVLSPTESEFQHYLKKASHYNARAQSSRPKDLYTNLEYRLDEWKNLPNGLYRAQTRLRAFEEASLKSKAR